MFLEAPAKPVQSDLPIAVLAAALPGHHHYAGGEMREADGAVGHVLVLPALASGAQGVDPTFTQEHLVGLGEGVVPGCSRLAHW